jgi:hypothetical protein
LILIYGFFNFLIFIKGLYESKTKKNASGLTYFLVPMGIFVWGDAVVFGLFWFLVSGVVSWLNDWLLFWLVFSLFWVVRSLGETIFYFNQQFSKVNRQPSKDLPGYRLFQNDALWQNDAIWFVYQTFCQVITVISLVASLCFAKLWLQSRF